MYFLLGDSKGNNSNIKLGWSEIMGEIVGNPKMFKPLFIKSYGCFLFIQFKQWGNLYSRRSKRNDLTWCHQNGMIETRFSTSF